MNDSKPTDATFENHEQYAERIRGMVESEMQGWNFCKGSTTENALAAIAQNQVVLGRLLAELILK